LTISGDIDARNIDRVSAYAARLVLVGSALILDLSGVIFLRRSKHFTVGRRR
jgi:hypothetical protein